MISLFRPQWAGRMATGGSVFKLSTVHFSLVTQKAREATQNPSRLRNMMADPATFIASWLTPSSLFIFVNLVIGTIAITSRFAATPNRQQIHEPQLVRSPSLLDRVRSFNLRHYNHHEPTFLSQPESESESESECTQPQLVRSPSLLDRIRSVSLRHYTHQEPTFVAQPESECTQPQLVRTPSLLDRVRSFNLALYKHEPADADAESEYTPPEPDDPDGPQLVRTPSLLQRVRSMSFSRLYRSDSVHREGEDPDPKPNPGRDSGNWEKSKAEMKKSASERAGSMNCEREEEDEGTVERRRPATARTETTSWREDEEVDAKADDFINRFKKQLRLQRIDSLLRYRDTMRGN